MIEAVQESRGRVQAAVEGWTATTPAKTPPKQDEGNQSAVEGASVIFLSSTSTMSTPRLTFLYPFLFKPVTRTPFSREVSRTGRQVFRSAAKRSQTARPVRYGKANEPPPYLAGVKGIPAVLPGDAAPQDAKALPQPTKKDEESAKSKDKDKVKDAPGPIPGEKPLRPSRLPESPVLDAAESQPIGPPPPTPHLPSKKPLETVLNMPASDSQQTATAPVYQEHNRDPQSEINQVTKAIDEEAAKRPRPPHIDAPDYVHHFDTYGLVKRLEDGGWSQAQSITIMKATRLILSENIDLARNALVSKSNVENEAYLFRAACSELHTEINTKRRAEAERARTERSRLEHEVDILGQRISQDSGNLKDELKGMFDDRKMGVQNEQRDIERKIQELNYRITVLLNSDSRSDVEGVRWIITKRAISALAICVLMILGSIKFASTAMTWHEDERKRMAALVANNNNNPTSSSVSGNSSSGQNSLLDRANEDLGQGDILVRQGDNPAFVSLG